MPVLVAVRSRRSLSVRMVVVAIVMRVGGLVAAHTRRSIASRYRAHANRAVNRASSASINEPLVCCRPHASAAGPMPAPNKAITARRRKPPRSAAQRREFVRFHGNSSSSGL